MAIACQSIGGIKICMHDLENCTFSARTYLKLDFSFLPLETMTPAISPVGLNGAYPLSINQLLQSTTMKSLKTILMKNATNGLRSANNAFINFVRISGYP